MITEKEQTILAVLADKLGKEIVHIDLRRLGGRPSDSFIICHGRNERHVEALAREVIFRLKHRYGELPFSVEGLQQGRWVVIDYFDTILHIFRDENIRRHYDLEGLWHDGRFTPFRPEPMPQETTPLSGNARPTH